MINPLFFNILETKFFKKFTEDPDVIGIFLTGSRVMGENLALPTSDYDVIVVLDMPYSEFPYKIDEHKELYSGPVLSFDNGDTTISFLFSSAEKVLSDQIHDSYSWMDIYPAAKIVLYSTPKFDKFLNWCNINEHKHLEYLIVSAAHFYLNKEDYYNKDKKSINSIIFYNHLFNINTDYDQLKKWKINNHIPEEIASDYREKMITFARENYPWELDHFDEFTANMNKKIMEVMNE